MNLDLNLLKRNPQKIKAFSFFFSTNRRIWKKIEDREIEEEMESDLQHDQLLVHDQNQHHHQQMNSGLMRYQSAPSLYFADIMDREFCKQFLNRPSSPETERIFARFMKSDSGDDNTATQPVTDQTNQQAQFVTPTVKINETAAFQQKQQSNINTYSSSASQGFYQSSPKPPLPNQSLASAKKAKYSKGKNQFPQMRAGGVSDSTLLRQRSSPVGLFADLDLDTASLNFSSGPSSSSMLISSIEDKGRGIVKLESGAFVETREDNFAAGFFPSSGWEETAVLSDNITSLKRLRDEDEKVFSGLNPSEIQNLEATETHPPTVRSHHISLPKTAAEMTTIEKILFSPDSVPCKIRAKRGFATHPRSIAERVRRTKISERMRKIQELVPNMEKQTNTADMLDLAVDYIKDLQDQAQTLSDKRVKCTCSIKL